MINNVLKYSITAICIGGIIYISFDFFNKNNKNNKKKCIKADIFIKNCEELNCKETQTLEIENIKNTKETQCDIDIDNLVKNGVVKETYNKSNTRWLFT